MHLGDDHGTHLVATWLYHQVLDMSKSNHEACQRGKREDHITDSRPQRLLLATKHTFAVTGSSLSLSLSFLRVDFGYKGLLHNIPSSYPGGRQMLVRNARVHACEAVETIMLKTSTCWSTRTFISPSRTVLLGK